MKHGFNPETNDALIFGGITVSLPNYWIQYNDDNENPLYCAETGDKISELLFSYEKSDLEGSEFSSGISDIMNDYMTNKTSDLSDVALASATECEGIPAYSVGYQGKMGNNEMVGRCCFVYDPSDGSILVLDLRQTDNTDYIYFDDFNAMVSSIEVEGSIEEDAEEVSEEVLSAKQHDDSAARRISENDSTTRKDESKDKDIEGDKGERDEKTDGEADNDLAYKVFPYPDEADITNVDDYKSFYRNYKSAYNQNWYRMTMPVYSVSGNSIIVHDDLHKALGMISVEFAEPNATSSLRRGDEVTVVALSKTN